MGRVVKEQEYQRESSRPSVVQFCYSAFFVSIHALGALASLRRELLPRGLGPVGRVDKEVTWLILPVVICLSQRLSHACLSINNFIL
jgi:hypothetical protein